MRLRSALLATCVVSVGAAVATASQPLSQPPAHQMSPEPAPAIVPQPPAPPRRPPPPEVTAAFADARATEALLVAGRDEEAIANYRRSAETPVPPGGDVGAVAFVRAIHFKVLAALLVLHGRDDDADNLIQEFIAAWLQAPLPRARRDLVLELHALRLYIASGRGDAEGLVALIEQRAAIEGGESYFYRCVAPPYMPDVIAPMHHDARVRAALERYGCDPEIIEQIDRLAARPTESAVPLPAPGLRRVPAASEEPVLSPR